MNYIIKSLLTIAQKSQEMARLAGNVELYSQAQDIERLAKALETIEETALKGPYSQVDLKFYCYGSLDGDMVDYEVNGFDAEGYESSIIASDLNASSFVRAIIEMADNLRENEV